MFLPVLAVAGGQGCVAQNEQVPGVALFGGLGKVERAGQDRSAIHKQDFVMRASGSANRSLRGS
jgi:hypothetical protein